MLWLFLGPMSYLLMGYALFSMPALTPTSSNITLESSFITRTTVTSGLSHPTNLSDALDSLIESLITYHTLLTNLHWTPRCHPPFSMAPWANPFVSFIPLWREQWNIFAKPICCPSCHHSGICQWCNWRLSPITRTVDSSILRWHWDERHPQACPQSLQNQLIHT